MKNFILIIIILGIGFNCFSQNNINDILRNIDKNNTELQGEKVNFQSMGLEIDKTQNLSNPEFEYTNSFSKEDGKPYEMSLSQAFDFPSAYIHKKEIISQKKNNLQYLYNSKRQDIILRAKLICYELVYKTKQENELNNRYTRAKELMVFFEEKLKNGDSNIIETNKIKMVLLNTKNKLSIVKRDIKKLNIEISMLNGGIKANTLGMDYVQNAIIDKNIEQEFLINSPSIKAVRNMENIAKKEILLAKANTLPKFSIGYRYMDSQISKASTGLKFGLSLPLWAGKNTVKIARAKSIITKKYNEQFILNKTSEIKNLYIEYLQLKESKDEYKNILTDNNIDELLRKALKYGEISSIDYFNESIYYYDSIDTYLEIEFNYQKCIAIMLKHKL